MFKIRSRKLLSGLLVLFGGMIAHGALSPSDPTTEWTAMPYPPGMVSDYTQDQQTGSTESDIVGTNELPAVYTTFIPGTSATNGTIGYRFRLGRDNNPVGFTQVALMGIEANNSGVLSVFVGVDNSGTPNRIRIFRAGTGANVSPSTTSIDSGNPIFSYSQGTNNYNWQIVSGTSDPAVLTSTNPTPLNVDGSTSSGDQTDYFLSFFVPFADLVSAFQNVGITNVSTNSTFRYIIGTSTQPNAINQDINGLQGQLNSTVAYTNLNIFTLPITPGGVLLNNPPIAMDDVTNTLEDTAVIISVLNNDSDPDGDSLSIVSATATNGTVSISGTNLVFSPVTNSNGATFINYTISDGKGGTNSAVVTITVTPVNDAPVANNQSVFTPEDVSTNIVLSAIDTEGAVTFAILNGPTNGIVSGFNASSGAFTYVPNTNFNGADTIQFTATDGELLATGIVDIVVTPLNDTPVANDDNYSLLKNATLTVEASGVLTNDFDVENSILTATLVDDVSHGTLNLLSDGSFTYTPSNNYVGPDSFTYTANDGTTNSGVAQVSLAILATNSAPIASGQSVTTSEDTATNLVLIASDADDDSLTFSIVSAPTNGVLSGLNVANGTVTYLPNTNFNGNDSFTFRVNDGAIDSETATVNITVIPVNDAPIATSQSMITPEDVATNIVLIGTDVESAVTFAILSGPTNGIVSGFNANSGELTYAPNTNFNGVDTITFTVTDGSLFATGIVSITVTPVNDAPIANNQLVITPEDVSTNIVLVGTDIESAVTFAILSGPTNGVVSGFNANSGEFAYAPNTNFNGADTIVFTVTDGSLLATAIVSIAVTPVNDPPAANDDLASTPEDTAVTISVLTNDTDVDGDTLSIVSAMATNGSVNIAGTNLLFTPTTNFIGIALIDYAITDGNGATNSAVVTITVNGLNDPPVANDDVASTEEDVVVTIPVLINDNDPDDDPLTIIDATTTNGAVSIAGTNLVFTPATNFNGIVLLDYVIADGNGGSNSAVVTVTVDPVNDAPIAQNQIVATPEDTATNIVPIGSDIESTVTFAILNGPTNGLVSGFNANSGEFIYAPNTNFNGTDTIIFTVSDGSLLATGTVSIAVTPLNDAPIANDDNVSTPEDLAVIIPVLINDTDPDGDVLSIVSATATNGTVDVVGTNLVFTPATNFIGVGLVNYTITDGNSGTTSAIVTVTVSPINDPPVASDDATNTPEDTTATISVLANDSDPDNDDLAIVAVTTTNGIVTVLGTNLVFTPATNFNGVVLIDYTITDGNGGTNSAVVTVTVDPVNDAPIADNQSVITPEDISTNLVLTGTDVEGAVTFAILSAPTNGIVGGFNPNTGELVYTSNTNFNGTDAIVFTVTDGSLSATGIVSVTVTPLNDAPVANDDSYSLLKNTDLLVSVFSGVLTNDSDIEGDFLTASLVSNVAHGTLNLLADGSFTYTPSNNYVGPDSFTYQANDGTTNFSVALVSLTIIPTNSAPMVNGQSVTTPEDTATNLVLAATDTDGDTLTFLIVNGPTNGVLNGFNPANGTVTYLPNTNFNGSDSFTFQVNDGTTNSETAIVSITITAVNDAPIAVDQNVTTPEDTSTNIVLIGTDTESAVTFAILSGPTNGAINGFNANTGALVYSPITNFNGVDAIVFTVSDGTLLATGIVSIAVTPINDGPVANNQNVVTPEDVSTNIVLSGVDLESAVTFAILSAPTNGIVSGFNGNTGALLYTPNTNYNGVDTIVFTVTDGSLVATGIVNIAVTPVNDPPVANDDLASTPEDIAVTISVLTNDTDADGDPLSIVSAITTNGSVNVVGTNLLFTPTTNFNGIALINYAITDGNGETNSAVVTVTVDPVNDAPIANNQLIITPEDVSTNIVLMGTDAESVITFAILNDPTNGVISEFDTNTGALTYTPNTNFNGPDTFTFLVSDGSLLATGTVDIVVTPINDAPLANNGNVITPEDTSINLVLGGTDVDSAVTFAILNLPTNGTINGFNTSSGELTYTPNTNFNGVDTIVFTVTDGSLLATGIVSITVTPVNDGPSANDQNVTTLEDVATSIVLSGSDVESPVTFAIHSGPAHGAISGLDSSTGALLYTPATNFNGSDSFTFLVSDGSLFATGSVFITVLPANDAPIANDDSASTPEDSSVVIPVLTNDTDPDGDSLSIISANATNGSVSISGTNLVFDPATNFTGTALIDYTISDGNGGTDSAVVTVNVFAQADVALVKSGPAHIISGGTITYTLFVSNSGPSIAENIVVEDQMPANLTFQSASSGGTFTSGSVVWSGINLAPGAFTNYTLVALVPATGAFTNVALATSSTLDPVPSNNNGTANESQVATAVVVPEFGILQGPTLFNPQTGLFEQRVTITNTSAVTVSAVRLYVDGLRAGVILQNATGNDGRLYVQYNAPLNPNETVVLRLEFYVADRRAFTNSLEAVAVLPSLTGANAAAGVFIDRSFIDSRIVDEPRYVIEFATIPGRTYTVIYSDDQMNTWKAATPSIIAGASRAQWYDDGSPKTVSKPSSVGSRFYRVIVAPVNP